MTAAQQMQSMKTMFIGNEEASNAFMMYLAMIEDMTIPAQANVREAVNTLYHVAQHFMLENENVG